MEFRIRVGADVKLLSAVQTDVGEIRSEILGVRPFSGGIRKHERDVVPPQQREKLRHKKRRVSDLYCIT